MQEAAKRFDPALLTPAECAAAIDDLAAIERTAAHLKALAAARVAETDLWRRSGAKTPEEDLARRTGTSVPRAKEQLDTARRATSQPALDRAAREGRLSPEQAAAIADAAAVDPAAEAGLVERAGRESLRELREECGRVKQAATDPEERHRRLHRERRWRTWTDADGGWNGHLRTTPEVGAAIEAVLQPERERRFDEARRAGEQEPYEAYAADAVVERLLRADDGAAAERTAPAKVAARQAKVIVRVDWDALVRGFPVAGEVCEIAGIGPVPVSVVEAMQATGDAFLAAVVTRGTAVGRVVHLGRKPTEHQVTALQWTDPCCRVLGCTRTHTEIDHRADWARTKVTVLGLLDRLCSHHHAKKTREGWALVPGSGKRPMVPPDDPRHPKHAKHDRWARAG